MSTTTQAVPEAQFETTPQYRLTIFFFNAYLFRDLCKEMEVPYETFSDADFPHFNIFQFSGREEFMTKLIQRFVKAGCPFDLSNFGLKDAI